MPLARITAPIATITPITKRPKVVFGSDRGVSAFVIFVEFKVGSNPFSPYHIFIQAIIPITRIIEPIMILLIPIIRSKPYYILNKSNRPLRILISQTSLNAQIEQTKMGLFNRKKDPEKEARKELEKTVKDMKECGIDPYDIEQHILAHCNEGRNVDKDGKVFWVCSHCAANIKFKTREEYVAHHSRVHS